MVEHVGSSSADVKASEGENFPHSLRSRGGDTPYGPFDLCSAISISQNKPSVGKRCVMRSEAFLSLARGCLGNGFKDGWLTMIHEAYFDETGTHNKHLLTVAGLIADFDSWQRFYGRWIKLFGPDKAVAFKSDEANLEDLLAAGQLIGRTAMAGFCVHICPKAYEKTISQRFRSQHGSAYTVSLKEATSQVGMWANRRSDVKGQIAYFFDGGHRNQEQANNYFQRVFNKMPVERRKLRLASWAFADDKVLWPLKAADVLARGCLIKHSTGETPLFMSAITERIQVISAVITDEGARGWVAQLAQLYEDRKAVRKLLKRATLKP